MDEKITCRCDACGKTLAVPAHAAGKKIRCPSCQGIVSVPGPGASGPASPGPAASNPPERPRQEEPPRKKSSPPSKPKSEGSKQKPKAKPKRVPDPWEAEDGEDPYADAYSYANAPLPPRETKRHSERSAPQSVPTQSYEPYSAPALEDRLSRTSGDDDELTTQDVLLCIFCSNIACIIGLVRIATGRSSSGLKMIMICFLMNIIGTIIGVVVGVLSSLGNAGG